MRTAIAARSIWKKMKFPFLGEKLLEICGEPWVGYVTEDQMRYCSPWSVRLCMEEHGMVEMHNSPEYDGGPWQSHKREA